MYKVWLEWDFGQDNYIFSTREKAISWVNDQIEVSDAEFKSEFPNGFDDLYGAGYCEIEFLEII